VPMPASSNAVERLSPFGVVLTGGGASLASLEPTQLDRLALDEKLIVLRGFAPVERDDFLAYCRSFPGRSLLEWDFGPVMEMHERPDAKNYLFSREAVPFHWDGAFHKVPTFLMFYCVEAPLPGAGGETLFCDTERIFAGAPAAEKEELARIALTYETKKLAHYGGKITNPLLQQHPATGRPILRFAEPVETQLNPVTLAIDGLPAAEHASFLARMKERIYSPLHCYQHTWQNGDILMADNTLIHGRRAFELDCPRHLRRIQLV
jgi:alpha-ketoglutarate-dependent taurine dioxygenase